MSTKAVFTMKLDAELRDAFKEAAASDDRPAAQIVRELMRGYINERRQARAYNEFVRRKVEVARKQQTAGQYVTHEEVEAEAAKRRAELLRRADEMGL